MPVDIRSVVYPEEIDMLKNHSIVQNIERALVCVETAHTW